MRTDLTYATSIEWPTDAIPQKWIQKLFNEMLLAYGKKFTEQWAGADPESLQRHWATKLAGMTGPEMKRGVDKLDSRDWPPTLPEFIKMCKPSVDPLIAYYEAVAGVQSRSKGEMGTWSHPAIYWAATPMAFDLSNQTYSQIKPRWERALSDQMERGEWEEVKMPLVALPEAARFSREEASKRLHEVGAIGMIRGDDDRTDHKAWAKIAMDDLKNGGKRFPAITYKMAKEALAA
jgi:hypothetical protein